MTNNLYQRFWSAYVACVDLVFTGALVVIWVLAILYSLFVAYEADAADNMFFYGCMNNKTGRVRKISGDVPQCREGSTLVQWNQVGPQGVQGEKGNTGDIGPQGIQGPTGPQGPSGNTLHLYDANGQDLGILLMSKFCNGSNDIQMHNVFLPALGLIFYVFETGEYSAIGVPPPHTAFISGRECSSGVDIRNGNETTWFSGQDCIGTASAGVPNRYSLIKNNFVNYYRFNSGIFDTMASSVRNSDGVCSNYETPFSRYALPLEEVTLPFTEPLAWPLRIEAR